MSSTPDGTTHTSSNAPLTLDSSDLARRDAQKDLNSTSASTAMSVDIDSHHEIPMNLLPAGNCFGVCALCSILQSIGVFVKHKI